MGPLESGGHRYGDTRPLARNPRVRAIRTRPMHVVLMSAPVLPSAAGLAMGSSDSERSMGRGRPASGSTARRTLNVAWRPSFLNKAARLDGVNQ